MKKLTILFLALALNANAGDVEKGKMKFEGFGCNSCHGNAGIGIAPQYPNLAGLDSAYIIKQLKDFQSGTRVDPTMNAMAPMTAGHEDDIASYLETLLSEWNRV